MSFLAPDDTASYAWRQDFIETFLSRDAARFGITLPPEQLRRFSTDRGRAAGPTFAATGRVVTKVFCLCGAILEGAIFPFLGAL